MATYQPFDSFIAALGRGEHHLHAAGDTLKAYLTNEQPLASDDVKADIAEITNQNGYTAPVDIQNDYTEAAGVGTLTAVDATITASGGTVGPFRWVVIYNFSHASAALVCWYDYGAEVTLGAGESLALDFGAALLTIGPAVAA
jgi:hypothetical protein